MYGVFNFKEVCYRASRDDDDISISKQGYIGLTPHFVKTYGITAHTRAYLFYAYADKVMALSFAEDADPATFPITIAQGGGADIPASQYFAANQINPADCAGLYWYEQCRGRDVGLPDVPIVFTMRLEMDDKEADQDGGNK